jgi:D-amino peptidase
MKKIILSCLSVVFLGAAMVLLFQCAGAQSGPKVLLVYDLEGVTAADAPGDVSFGQRDYAAIQESLTQDVNAAIRGLLRAGASEVVLTDGHGSGNPEPDYLVARLPDGARHNFQDGIYDSYIDALDESFDAVACVGMHSRAGGEGFLAHTYYGHTKWVMAGYDMNESMIVAASAARFDIPLILVTGDDILQGEIEGFSPETRYVAVKEARNRSRAVPRPQEEVNAEIEAAAEDALRSLRLIPVWDPPEIKTSFENLYSYNQPMFATYAMDFPGAKGVNNKTISVSTDSFLEAYQTYRILCNYTVFARMGMLVQNMRGEEGSIALLRKAAAKMPSQGKRDFEPTGDKIDHSHYTVRGRHGYR